MGYIIPNLSIVIAPRWEITILSNFLLWAYKNHSKCAQISSNFAITSNTKACWTSLPQSENQTTITKIPKLYSRSILTM